VARRFSDGNGKEVKKREALSAGEKCCDLLPAESKDSLKHRPHPEAMNWCGEWAEGQSVGYPIGHFYPVVASDKQVFMVPDAVGSGTLLVDEESARADMRDFGQPANANARKESDAIGDHLACIHGAGVGQSLEMELGRGERIQILRRGEKFPHRFR